MKTSTLDLLVRLGAALIDDARARRGLPPVCGPALEEAARPKKKGRRRRGTSASSPRVLVVDPVPAHPALPAGGGR